MLARLGADVTLSDYEQRVLGQIERELAADRRLASHLDRSHRTSRSHRLVKAAALFACGLTTMLLAILMPPATVGFVAILGFAAMFTGSVYALIDLPMTGNR
jgi:hypothetical protein